MKSKLAAVTIQQINITIISNLAVKVISGQVPV